MRRLLILLAAFALAVPAQKITTPKEQFGFNLGDRKSVV